MSEVRAYVERSGYAAALGVEIRELDDDTAVLALPFREVNSNPGGALHGGCAASLAAMGAQLVTRNALGSAAGPFVLAGLQVNYLAAAINEEVLAKARLQRRGKEMCFVDVRAERHDGKAIASATAMVRARQGAPPAELASYAGERGGDDPGFLGPHAAKMPYMAARGIDVQYGVDGGARVAIPASDANRDNEGGVHEGAVLALLDTAGAMASWGVAGRGPHKASTPSMQAQLLAPPPDEPLLAFARVAQRDGSQYWTDALAIGAETERVFARATVLYRIVIAEG
jgi:uncharacterized protein (TIGR00369 family)